jgi:hypothetical protein
VVAGKPEGAAPPDPQPADKIGGGQSPSSR